jgi:hypothetical protein
LRPSQPIVFRTASRVPSNLMARSASASRHVRCPSHTPARAETVQSMRATVGSRGSLSVDDAPSGERTSHHQRGGGTSLNRRCSAIDLPAAGEPPGGPGQQDRRIGPGGQAGEQLFETLRVIGQCGVDEADVDLGLAGGALLMLVEHVAGGEVPGRHREHGHHQCQADAERGRDPPAQRKPPDHGSGAMR